MDALLEKQIQKLKNGEADAFDKVYEMTYRKIYFVVLPILRDRSLTEDIVQDTYLKFLEKLYEYESRNSLAYILTIARNLALNEFNRRKRETKDFEIDDQVFSLSEHVEIQTERQALIGDALSVLSVTERNIFLLHNLENLTHREISMVLDIPLGTVTWSYQQAIRKMRKKLEGLS